MKNKKKYVRSYKTLTIAFRVTEGQHKYMTSIANSECLLVSEWVSAACKEKLGINEEQWRKL